MVSIILGDVGGTNTRIAATDDAGHLGNTIRIPTPKDFEEAVSLFRAHSLQLLSGEQCAGAVLGLTGLLNEDRSLVLHSDANPHWEGKDIQRIFSDALGASVYFENDAILAALGEAVFGIGRGYGIVAYITVSTGVGGARIVYGKVDSAKYGFEPGDQIIRAERAFSSVERKQSGAYLDVSGTALQRRLSQSPRDIPQEHPIWDEYARDLAVALYNLTLFWCPHIIILGGAMIAGTPAIPLDKIRQYTNELVSALYPQCPVIAQAILGDDAGLHGALAYAREKLGL